jgi:hypothetical protein
MTTKIDKAILCGGPGDGMTTIVPYGHYPPITTIRYLNCQVQYRHIGYGVYVLANPQDEWEEIKELARS